MAQVTDRDAFLRERLQPDGEPRRSCFTTLDGGTRACPARCGIAGTGRCSPSLPPGEWTRAWTRDGAYAAVALAGARADAGLARRALLRARRRGRSLRRVERAAARGHRRTSQASRVTSGSASRGRLQRFRSQPRATASGSCCGRCANTSAAGHDARRRAVERHRHAHRRSPRLIDPATGLPPDSSIWETHWNGRQRTWAYTNLVAVRGLCDASSSRKPR